MPAVEFASDAAFRKWLFSWAENKLRNRLRFQAAAKRDPGKEVDAPTEIRNPGQLASSHQTFCRPSQAAIAREEIARIEAVFDQLPPHYREVITLSYLVGLSHAEIGEQMGRTPAASRSLLNRALARLATLSDLEPG